MAEDRIAGLLSQIGFSVHELLRYLYGGLLCIVVAVLVDPTWTKQVREALGPALCLVSALAAGAAVYALYRPIVGEQLFRLQENIHSSARFNSRGLSCRTAALKKQYSLESIGDAITAFRVIRDSKHFDQVLQGRYYRQHSELHAVFVTFFVTAIGSLVLWAKYLADQGSNPTCGKALVLTIVSVFALLSGVVGNMQLCTQECKTLLLVDVEDGRKLLEQTACIQKPEEPQKRHTPTV